MREDYGFYMGDSFDRVETMYNSWSPQSIETNSKCLSVNATTSSVNNRLEKIESSFDKFCGGCVNFAANVDEAREAFKKMAESLNKLGVGVRLCRDNLKTLGGNGRYV